MQTVRRPSTTVLLLLVGLAALAPSAAASTRSPTPAHLTVTDGVVLAQPAGEPAWLAGGVNFPLDVGDAVWVTRGARAEIALPAGHRIRLGEDTRIVLVDLAPAAATILRVEGGRIRVGGERIAPRGALQIHIPGARVEPRPGTILGIDVRPDDRARVLVRAGEARVTLPSGGVPVGSGRGLTLDPGGRPSSVVLVEFDLLEGWSRERDRELSRAPGSGSLPSALTPYAAELATYGRWVRMTDQGEAWAPRVEPDWTPFRAGYWARWRGDLVWVANEPWGWIAFHYGRWLHALSIGWVWVPPAENAVVWHPGAVAWLSEAGLVGWVPLAPAEPESGGSWGSAGLTRDSAEEVNPSGTDLVVAPVCVTEVFVTQIFAPFFVNARARQAVVVMARHGLAGHRPDEGGVRAPPHGVHAPGVAGISGAVATTAARERGTPGRPALGPTGAPSPSWGKARTDVGSGPVPRGVGGGASGTVGLFRGSALEASGSWGGLAPRGASIGSRSGASRSPWR